MDDVVDRACGVGRIRCAVRYPLRGNSWWMRGLSSTAVLLYVGPKWTMDDGCEATIDDQRAVRIWKLVAHRCDQGISGW
ncbi:MAG: hypothetical protein J0M02_01790 [Planctomycetes bacterium]|nr:hypothetical protein [Planctomycetota bacterium]